jgi:hypothetical protein
MKQAPAGSVGFTSDSGWITEDIFVRWLDHFAMKANCGEEKTLLILDNHASHCSLAAITRARELNIEMISIPPHCSHKLQPLDRTFFGSLKNEFRKESFNYLRSNPGKRISQYEIAELFTPAYTRAASLDKGVNGFRTCGIFPLNPDIFSDQDFAPSEVTERDDALAPSTSGTTSAPSTSGTASASAPSTSGTTSASSTRGTTSASAPSTSGTTSASAPSTSGTASAPSTSGTASAPSTNGTTLWEAVSPLPKCIRNTGTQRKRRCGQSEHLTGSPFKNKKYLTEKSKSKKSDAKSAKGKGKAKKALTEIDRIPQDFFCIYCNEQYVDPPTEDWIECHKCKKWCHENCALVTENNYFICDLCI